MTRQIFLDARLFFYSGIGRCIRNYITSLAEFDYSIVAAVQRWEDASRLRRWVEGPSDHIHTVIVRSSPHGLRQYLGMSPGTVPDVVGYLYPQYSIAPLLLPKKSIVMIHDLFQLRPAPTREGGGSLRQHARCMMATLALRSAIARSWRLVCTSEQTRSELVLRFPAAEGKAIVIEPGLPTQGWFPLERTQQEAVRTSLRLPRFFLAVGIKEARKNHRYLLDLLPPFLDRQPGFKIVLVGEEPRRRSKSEARAWDQDLRAWKIEYPRHADAFVDLGEVSEFQLWKLYASAEALLLPSRSEGFGLPVLEAASCGTRILCSENVPAAHVDAAADLCKIIPLSSPSLWVEEMVAITARAPSLLAQGQRASTSMQLNVRSWRAATSELVGLMNELDG